MAINTHLMDEIQKETVRVSVRSLVEFILRSGDIDNRISSQARQDAMLQGSRIHRKLQSREGADYEAEVPLKIEIVQELYTLVVEGRADGIITKRQEDGQEVWIDEIKGVLRDVMEMEEPVPVHLAQAKCYAYIYASKHHFSKIGVRLTYCSMDTEELRRFYEEYTYDGLEEWFLDLIAQYHKWANWQFLWRKRRNDSIRPMQFPFPYRKGQKELAASVYTSIRHKKNLFIQAPTGTGKTISVLFPAVKSVGEGLVDKIFYLTAKTITRTVAWETVSILRERGYQAKVLEITAKEKLCLLDKMDCNPPHCPYAKGHYDRVNDAVFDLLGKQEDLTREVFLAQAEAFCVCPFELCLDTADWSDIILCDYNYAFDPNVHLKRFFSERKKEDYLFLVDEAHNLVDRARHMYSAALYKEDILNVRRIVQPLCAKTERQLSRCNKLFLELKRECKTYRVYESISTVVFALMRLAAAFDTFLRERREFEKRQEVMTFYFDLRHFLNMCELVDENYVIYTKLEEDGRFLLRLFCIGTAKNLQSYLDRGLNAVFFSATLLPVLYYRQLLNMDQNPYAIYAQSVFEKEQSCILVADDVSSKYTRRKTDEFLKIAKYIAGALEVKPGNYIVFFPSYKMAGQVAEQFYGLEQADRTECIVQGSNMTEQMREEFLAEFSKKREKALCAFCVMGGIFSEGIDLRGSQLIGAVIVGTGLPFLCSEREILKQFYDEKGQDGFAYAYLYPGINKVLQAAGRVIRTSMDKGVILLLDERFHRADHKRLLPREWSHAIRCNINDYKDKLEQFWRL